MCWHMALQQRYFSWGGRCERTSRLDPHSRRFCHQSDRNVWGGFALESRGRVGDSVMDDAIAAAAFGLVQGCVRVAK